MIFALAAVMMTGIVLGFMDDQVKGLGKVTGIREYSLKSLVSSKIVKVHHHEGEEVQQGEVLLEFDDRNQRDRITLLKNDIKELSLQIEVKNKALELLRKDPLPDYYRHTELQLKEAKERQIRSEHELKVYSDLFEHKVITRKEYLKAELDHLSNKMAVQRLENDWKKLNDGMAGKIIERAEEELRLLKQKLSGKRDELAMAIRRLEDYVMRAPDAGVLTDIPPRPGGYYEKGEVVIRFSANQGKKVIALIDEKQIFKVFPGQSVRIYCHQYNYLDYGYFRGKVDTIYQLPEVIGGRNFYPVKIVLTSEQQPLRFGAGCEVTIITGRERIIFVLLGIRSQEFLERRGLKKQIQTTLAR